jgi:hypothetical protein
MCLMLYVATAAPLAARNLPEFSVVPDESGIAEVRHAFSLPHVQFLGAPGACNCCFPHVLCNQPFDYYDGMFAPAAERRDEVATVERLLAIMREALQAGGSVELWPVWNGDEGRAPMGRIDRRAAELVAERFFFVERFLHVVHG